MENKNRKVLMLFEYFPPYKSHLRWCINTLWKYNNSKTITISLWRPILCRCWFTIEKAKNKTKMMRLFVALVSCRQWELGITLVHVWFSCLPFHTPIFPLEWNIPCCNVNVRHINDVLYNIGIAISIEQAIKYHHQYKYPLPRIRCYRMEIVFDLFRVTVASDVCERNCFSTLII